MAGNGEKFDAAVADMRETIRRDVAGGFRDAGGIATSAVEVAAEGEVRAADMEPLAEQFLREALAEHYRAQTAWPDRTDCDRLDDAFTELEARGIVCRQDFSCCSNCGETEIGAEMKGAEEVGVAVRGYVFYHMQDTDRAVLGGGLYLKYGAVEPGDEAGVGIGREIDAALTAHGLRTEWNGRLSDCVRVLLDWKRRRPLIAGFGCEQPRRPAN